MVRLVNYTAAFEPRWVNTNGVHLLNWSHRERCLHGKQSVFLFAESLDRRISTPWVFWSFLDIITQEKNGVVGPISW